MTTLSQNDLQQTISYLWNIIEKDADNSYKSLITAYNQHPWDTSIVQEQYSLDISPVLQKVADTFSDESFEELERKALERSLYEKVNRDLAFDLPPALVMWAFYRVLAHATSGAYGNVSPVDLTWNDAIDIWTKEVVEKDLTEKHIASVKEARDTENLPHRLNWDTIRNNLQDIQSLIAVLQTLAEQRTDDWYIPPEILEETLREWVSVSKVRGSQNITNLLYQQGELFWWISENFGAQTDKVLQDALGNERYLDVLESLLGRGNTDVQLRYKDVDELLSGLHKYVETLNSYLKQVGDTNINYQGLRVYNPDRLSVPLARKMLSYLDVLLRLLKERDLDQTFKKEIKGVTIRFAYQKDGRANAYYESKKQWLVLLHRMLDKDIRPRIGSDWPLEVVVHEFGHHLHMNYLNKTAQDFWDNPWEELEKIKTLENSGTVTPKERKYFYQILKARMSNTRNSVEKNFQTFVGHVTRGNFDERKLQAWLYKPSRLMPPQGALISEPNASYNLTPYGKSFLGFYADPKTYMSKRTDFDSWSERQQQKAIENKRRQFEELLGVSGKYAKEDYPDLPMSDEVEEMLQGYKTHDELIESLGLPTNYAATNVLEDFAETFATYLLNPGKLSPTARYRLFRTLSLSGLHGKPVMRIGNSDWEEVDLQEALDTFWPLVMDWVYHPSVGKKAMDKAYKELSRDQKKALKNDVQKSVQKHHGGRTFTAYRRIKGGPEVLKGLDSITTEFKSVAYLDPEFYREYEIKADDVLLHWGQDSPLASKGYGHEKEVILKPGVTVKPISVKVGKAVLAVVPPRNVVEALRKIDEDYYDNPKAGYKAANEYFKSIRAKRIGEGFGRVVWDIGKDRVVKYAANLLGRRQNQAEEEVWEDTNAKLLLPVLTASHYERWIAMRKIKPIRVSMSNFFVDSWYIFVDAISVKNPGKLLADLKSKDRDLYELAKIVLEYNLAYRDIMKVESWGLLQGKPRLFDYGLDNSSGNRMNRDETLTQSYE